MMDLVQREACSRPVRLAVGVIVANSVGNLALRIGMMQVGRTVSLSPIPYLAALLNPWVLSGVLLLIAYLVLQLSLLSRADLTYVLPVTGISYIVAVVLGALLLSEPVSPIHWTGLVLIAGGASVVSGTEPRSDKSGTGTAR